MKKRRILCIITFVSILCFLFYYYNGIVTEGYFVVNEENFLVENNKTFLFLNNKKIEVPQHLFDNIELRKRHHIRFSWNKLFNNNNKLDFIVLDNT